MFNDLQFSMDDIVDKIQSFECVVDDDCVRKTTTYAFSPTSVVPATVYNVGKLLVQSYSGMIYKGTEYTGSKQYPVVFKFFNNPEHYAMEKKALEQLIHPCIVKMRPEGMYSEWIMSPEIPSNDSILILDYCSGGDMFEYILKGPPVSLLQFRKISQKLLSALLFCKEKNVYHRDIKLENVFLDKKNDPTSVKLGDFGLSTDVPRSTQCCGTLGCMAPEIVSMSYDKYDGYDIELADVWALGVLLFSILFQTKPYHEPAGRGNLWRVYENRKGKHVNSSLVHLCTESYDHFWYAQHYYCLLYTSPSPRDS